MLMYRLCCFIFFFFKQKTAYEMRISDWSSDVCSSDRKIRHVHALLLCAARSAGPSLADRVSHAAGGREGRAGGVVGRPVLLPVARRPGEGRASSRPEDRKSVV